MSGHATVGDRVGSRLGDDDGARLGLTLGLCDGAALGVVGETLGDSVHAHPAQLWPILVNASHVYASCAKNHSSQFFGSCG